MKFAADHLEKRKKRTEEGFVVRWNNTQSFDHTEQQYVWRWESETFNSKTTESMVNLLIWHSQSSEPQLEPVACIKKWSPYQGEKSLKKTQLNCTNWTSDKTTKPNYYSNNKNYQLQ